jgi:3-methyladenine DNA glycosylase AlkD
MRNRERKMKKLEKKRDILKKEEVKELRSKPEIDINSQIVISNKEQYVPIYQRAAKLHSMKISKQKLNEENNKMKKEIEEQNILNQFKLRSKPFDQEEWDQFIERQNEWKDELQYKIKAVEIFRDNIDRQFFLSQK